MAPKSAAIPSSARRAKRIIQSPSGSSSGGSTPIPTAINVPASDRSLRTRNTTKKPVPPDDSEVEEITSEEEDDVDAEGEGEDDAEGEDDEDAEGELELDQEEEEGEQDDDQLKDDDPDGDVNMDRTRLSSAVASEDIPVEEDDDDEDAEGEEVDEDVEDDDEEADDVSPSKAPASALKIKFKLGANSASSSVPGSSGKRSGRPAAKKGAKKVKKATEDELAESDDELLLGDGDSIMSSRRSISPTKMTARQRAKGNKDLQETLLQLPNEVSGKKLILTEAEKLQRREETARRRKRQTEQKLQDEQDETINRLLRAQTSKSRSKLDQPSPSGGIEGEASGQVSPSKRVPGGMANSDLIRWSSTVNKNGDILLRVAAPKDKEEWISVSLPNNGTTTDNNVIGENGRINDKRGICNVDGCHENRKYRSTRKFEVGGCSLNHLKIVEAGL